MPSPQVTPHAPSRFSLARIGEVLQARTPRTIDGTTNAAAVALVLRESTRGLEALFIKRSDHPDDPWSGHIGLPGGRAESHDESLIHTAIRETEEEIGLPLISDRDLLGPLDETRATARNKSIDMKIAPFVFIAPTNAQAFVLSAEVAATHWVPLHVLFDSAHTASLTMEHSGQSLRFPSIDVGGLTIWGLTLRMLRNFETLVATP